MYELPLLQINTLSETFLHQSEAMRSADWAFIIGVPASRWLDEYVILDKTFYNLLFKQELLAAHLLPNFVPYRIPRGGFY